MKPVRRTTGGSRRRQHLTFPCCKARLSSGFRNGCKSCAGVFCPSIGGAVQAPRACRCEKLARWWTKRSVQDGGQEDAKQLGLPRARGKGAGFHADCPSSNDASEQAAYHASHIMLANAEMPAHRAAILGRLFCLALCSQTQRCQVAALTGWLLQPSCRVAPILGCLAALSLPPPTRLPFPFVPDVVSHCYAPTPSIPK